MEFKKHITKIIFLFVALLCVNSAFAYEVADVKSDYWASREIAQSLVNGYMTIDKNNNFRPEDIISRTDFVAALIKVLKEPNEAKTNEITAFEDISNDTRNLQSLLTAAKLQIIFGYPDKTFKPEEPILRTESSSILGHITKGSYDFAGILAAFDDADKIPAWAVLPCAKAVKYGFYVNHPNAKLFRPQDKLTRAEAAVLFDKILNSIDMIDPKYRTDLITKIPDIFLRSETLNVHEKSLSHQVDIYDAKNVVKAGNIIKAAFVTPLVYKKAKAGDIVEFTSKEALTTNEGTVLYPAGTKFAGEVVKINPTIWRDKNGSLLMVINKLTPVDGKTFEMAGVPLTRDKKILYFFKRPVLIFTKDKNQNWLVAKKVGKKEISEAEFLVNYAEKLAPNLKYNIDAKDLKKDNEIYVLLTDDLVMRHTIKEKL